MKAIQKILLPFPRKGDQPRNPRRIHIILTKKRQRLPFALRQRPGAGEASYSGDAPVAFVDLTPCDSDTQVIQLLASLPQIA